MYTRAIGLIHLGITDRVLACHSTIERLAREHGFTLLRIVTVDHDTYMPTAYILATAATLAATTIIAADLEQPDTDALKMASRTPSQATSRGAGTAVPR